VCEKLVTADQLVGGDCPGGREASAHGAVCVIGCRGMRWWHHSLGSKLPGQMTPNGPLVARIRTRPARHWSTPVWLIPIDRRWSFHVPKNPALKPEETEEWGR
jgi:hypothetical protein